MSEDDAFINSVESVTGPISRTISHDGILAVARSFEGRRPDEFQRAYSAAYHPAYEILWEIYDEVASGNEIRSVVMANRRFSRYPMGKIDGTPMWAVGEGVRRRRGSFDARINPTTAGVYIATMMAQVDLLKEKGHPYSRDRERVDHRGGRFAQPVHALQGRGVHGRQLLDDRASRRAQVGAALRLHPHAERAPRGSRARKQPTQN